MRNHLYKLIVHDATDHCYRNCLHHFRDNASILDVGIGNGMMMKTYHNLIKSKGLKIIGLDINRSYLNYCDFLINDYELNEHIRICRQPVETFEPEEDYSFDFILFSMSFMLMADQGKVVDRVKQWLKPEGEILFFQTVFTCKHRLMEIIKPRLKYLTTIDFGRVTYECDFYDLLETKDLSVVEDRLIKQTWFGGQYRMLVASNNGHP